MTKLISRTRMTEAEYLAFEEQSNVRHEYVDGYVYAMTGATQAHSLICMNIGAFLHGRLRGRPCRAMLNDMKVKIESARSFYYPDVVVNCASYKANDVIATEPALIVEVLSPSTAATDRREKRVAYQKIPTLIEYLIVHQKQRQVELYRRGTDGEWACSIARAGDEIVLESLPGGPTLLPLATIYEDHNPPTRVKEGGAEYYVSEWDLDEEE